MNGKYIFFKFYFYSFILFIYFFKKNSIKYYSLYLNLPQSDFVISLLFQHNHWTVCLHPVKIVIKHLL